jgi:hypothetical protein
MGSCEGLTVSGETGHSTASLFWPLGTCPSLQAASEGFARQLCGSSGQLYFISFLGL